MKNSIKNSFLVLFFLFTSCGEMVKLVDTKLEVSKTASLRRLDDNLFKVNQFIHSTDYNMDSIAIEPPLKPNDTDFVCNYRGTMDVTGVELYLSGRDTLCDSDKNYNINVKLSVNNQVLPGNIHLQRMGHNGKASSGSCVFPIAQPIGALEIKFITVPDSGNCARCVRPSGYLSLIRKGGPLMRGKLIKAYADLLPFYFDKKTRSGIILYTSWATYEHRSPGFPRYLNGKPYWAFIVLRNKTLLFLNSDDEDSNKIKIAQLKQVVPNIPDSITNDERLIRNSFLVD